MPDFHWQDTLNEPLVRRFPDQSIGIHAWRDLTDNLRTLATAPLAQLLRELEQFMQRARSELPPQPPECRVFVSHRQRQLDTEVAERIAFIATEEGFGYWLDIHDPDLTFMNGSAVPAPLKDILTAAIIEMGLLNSSHVIAAMTQNTIGSKWIPYEFGRAKYRSVHSLYSASWLYPAMVESDFGEYIYLAEIARTEGEIRNWLNVAPIAYCSGRGRASWNKPDGSPRPQANPLPTSP